MFQREKRKRQIFILMIIQINKKGLLPTCRSSTTCPTPSGRTGLRLMKMTSRRCLALSMCSWKLSLLNKSPSLTLGPYGPHYTCSIFFSVSVKSRARTSLPSLCMKWFWKSTSGSKTRTTKCLPSLLCISLILPVRRGKGLIFLLIIWLNSRISSWWTEMIINHITWKLLMNFIWNASTFVPKLGYRIPLLGPMVKCLENQFWSKLTHWLFVRKSRTNSKKARIVYQSKKLFKAMIVWKMKYSKMQTIIKINSHLMFTFLQEWTNCWKIINSLWLKKLGKNKKMRTDKINKCSDFHIFIASLFHFCFAHNILSLLLLIYSLKMSLWELVQNAKHAQ